MGKPTLVVVCGPAGTGKTTLAHRVGGLIGCPVVSMDEIKEGMVHANPGFVAAPADRLTLRTVDVFFDVIELMIRAGVTAVVEAAFQDHRWRPRLEPLRALADMRVLSCAVPDDIARYRQVRRQQDKPVRAAHADAEHLRMAATARGFAPLDLDVPTLSVDTSDGYRPSLAEIVEFAGSHASTR